MPFRFTTRNHPEADAPIGASVGWRYFLSLAMIVAVAVAVTVAAALII